MMSWKSAVKASKHNWQNVQHKQKNTAWKVSLFEVFLFYIFRHSDWKRRDTDYFSVFSQNVGECGPEKLRIRTLFTRWTTRTLSMQKKYFTTKSFGFILPRTKNLCTQQTFTCSKQPIETQEQGVNMFKVNNKETRTSLTSFLCLYCMWLRSGVFIEMSLLCLYCLWLRFGVFIVDFEHTSHLFLMLLLLTLNK